jgi:Flp pilus assembly protein TadB
VLERPLRYVAVIASAIVLVSFALFAIDETRSASAETRAAIAAQEVDGRDPEAARALERARDRRHSRVRREIDRANELVTRPFAGLVENSESAWMRRGIPAALALLLYGAGFAFLARFSKGSSRPRRASRSDVPHVTGRV